ncbi:hypothetical protein ACH4T9_12900 [Micromonospora sp. NPDC020750]|uniref:hypothetical protein n=1 Tax=unclassified Micromonospora TaxID=2617518 RepID=UPI0037B1FBCA
MTAPTIATALFMPDEPNWCDGACQHPDPGVIDHYSRTWEGEDLHDGASWRVQVTQRVQQAPDGSVIEGRAVIDVTGVEGAYGSTSSLARALMLAQVLADRINADRRRGA